MRNISTSDIDNISYAILISIFCFLFSRLLIHFPQDFYEYKNRKID